MALIECGECGNGISDRSESCIHCGCPLVRRAMPYGVQTIEKTGKIYKTQFLLAGLSFIIGGLMLFMDKKMIPFGAIIMFTSVVWVIFVKFAVWWNHE